MWLDTLGEDNGIVESRSRGLRQLHPSYRRCSRKLKCRGLKLCWLTRPTGFSTSLPIPTCIGLPTRLPMMEIPEPMTMRGTQNASQWRLICWKGRPITMPISGSLWNSPSFPMRCLLTIARTSTSTGITSQTFAGTITLTTVSFITTTSFTRTIWCRGLLCPQPHLWLRGRKSLLASTTM